MSVSINMRGKAATSGGAGGGGKSKLRRDWDALLDSPNPNTQQRFEEDFAMADPDSNMFNAKKILSNRNNLKNYANKSIPESRMNAMAAKIAAKQMKPLQDHISKTLDREITRLSRQTRPGAHIGDAGLRAISERQSRIANAMSTMGRLTGGKYALPVASQEVLSHAQSRIGAIQQAKQAQQTELLRAATNPANAHVSEFMKHKVKMEAQQQKQQALWMKNPANAHVSEYMKHKVKLEAQQAKWMTGDANAQVHAFRPSSGGDMTGLDAYTFTLLKALATFEKLITRGTTATWVWTADAKGLPVVDASKFPPQSVLLVMEVVDAYETALDRFLFGRPGDGVPPSAEVVASESDTPVQSV